VRAWTWWLDGGTIAGEEWPMVVSLLVCGVYEEWLVCAIAAAVV